MSENSNAPWDRTILVCAQRWDYCDPARGQSCDDKFFVQNFTRLVTRTEVFWYDELKGNLLELNRGLLRRFHEVKPDLVFFIPFQDQVHADTILQMTRSSTTMAWFGDDHWRFDQYSREYSKPFDVVVTTDPWSVGRYRADGREPVLSEWAGDLVMVDPIVNEDDFAHDATFVGMRTPYRSWFVKKLRSLGVDVKTYGYGWPAGRISFDEMNEVFRTSRINLNLSNSVSMDVRSIFHSPKALAMALFWSKRAEQVKARHFEIPGAGGFQLSYFVSGIERHLIPGTEIGLFGGPEDCARQIRHYLASPQERIAVAQAGHLRTVRDHTWPVRLGALLTGVWGPAEAEGS